MNKIYANKGLFIPVRQDESRTILSYDLVEEQDGVNATWHEIYFYKRRDGVPSFEQAKKAIIEDINARTDERILCGYEWTVLHGEDEGTIAKVWLSKENQENFKAKHDAALTYPNLVTFPMTYKIGESDDGAPIYEHFQSIEELAQFYLGGLVYIERCYNEGWQKKDNIDWTPYEEALNPSET